MHIQAFVFGNGITLRYMGSDEKQKQRYAQVNHMKIVKSLKNTSSETGVEFFTTFSFMERAEVTILPTEQLKTLTTVHSTYNDTTYNDI